MIKIHEKHWSLCHNDADLAYMTYYKEDKAFESRKATGTSWASSRRQNPEKEPLIFDNTPVEGFKIGDCMSRWSTSNKVFRVVDPRGFEVEIPSGNLATLVSCSTISKGVVQGECVWGREGNNHILLSVDSEPYLASLKEVKEDTVKKDNHATDMKNLTFGDTFESDYSSATFLMRAKVVYESPYERGRFIKDTKLENYFSCKGSYSDKRDVERSITKNFKKVDRNFKITKDDIFNRVSSYYTPNRIVDKTHEDLLYKRSSWGGYDFRRSEDWNIVGYQEKGSKEIIWKEGYEEKVKKGTLE